ncbi:MAG: mechanosensitive ion channel family protein [Gemmatimonadetes bacterium]|nr:mechanosensitive ion channel family protein [Gemmatimonadota bacterium]
MSQLLQLLDSMGRDRWARVVIALLLCAVTVRLVRTMVLRQMDDPDARYRASKVIGRVGWVAAVLLVVSSFAGSLSGMFASLSIIGAGIAFALQEVIASAAGRMAMMSGRFYRIGDRVQLGGIKGDVIDVGILRTTIMEIGDWVKGDLYTGRVVRVANSFVFKEPVYNYSGDFGFLWDEITLPVTYGVSHTLARAMLTRVVQEVVGEHVAPAAKEWREMLARFRVEDARLEPMVSLVLNDNWMEFTARYVVPFDRRRTVKDRLFTRIMDEVDASGGALQLASATSAIVAVPRLEVRLIDGKGEPSAS